MSRKLKMIEKVLDISIERVGERFQKMLDKYAEFVI